MELIPTELDGVIEVRPRRFGDDRGWFAETWKAASFDAAGVDAAFVQDNESFSAPAGTVRGLHYQLPPFAQAKLVRVVSGSILDIAVDIRRDSPSFAQHVAVTLSADEGNQLFVPAGFAHGFWTLEADVHVMYKVTAAYSPEHERAILWNDPALGIDWPTSGPSSAVLSDKDAVAPLLADQPDLF